MPAVHAPNSRLCFGFFYFEARLGRFLRFVLAIFSSSSWLIESAMLLDAPFKLDFGLSPRLADKAAPAAICCFFDLAGILSSLGLSVAVRTARGNAPGLTMGGKRDGSRVVPLDQRHTSRCDPTVSTNCRDREGEAQKTRQPRRV
jgi:hypothetical protein